MASRSSIGRSNPQKPGGVQWQRRNAMKLSRTLLALLALYGTAQAAELTLFKQPNFTGDALTLRNETQDLAGAGFQDQASSVVVRSGRWQVCTSPDFQGDCAVLG